MLIGYARVSTDEQQTNLQIDALTKAGCEVIFQEKASGVARDRPQLALALWKVSRGDTLVFYKIDRLARSMLHLSEISDRLRRRGVFIRSLTDTFDNSNPSGELMFNMLGSFAVFERALIIERTKAGLAAAKARGSKFGRPSPIAPFTSEILHLWRSGQWTKTALAAKFGTHISSIKRLLSKHSVAAGRVAA